LNILTGARFAGSAVLFAPKDTDVQQFPNTPLSNDPAQPSMHTSLLAEPTWITLHNEVLSDFGSLTAQEFVDAYEVMQKGVFGIDTTIPNYQEAYYMDSIYDVYDTTASGAPTYYEQPIDRWGELDPDRGYAYALDIPWIRFDVQTHWSIGPYQLGFGDTLRYVYAYVGGAISRKTSYLMVEELKRRDPIFNVYYDIGGLTPMPDLNDIAKDLLVATGKDSLFNNGMNAQRNFNMNYEVPESPAPPSVFEVTSGPDMIRLSWSYEPAYEPADLAKFKIYRALGGNVYEKQGEVVTGDWQLIDSVDGTAELYEDTNVTPAVDYYYALTAVSSSGVESGMWSGLSLIL
ncbi:MAG: fibronectin type III domain-containing protein, partial [candidate division WOR-3 bacterium]